MALEKYESTLARLRRRKDPVLSELHPELLARIRPILWECGWCFMPWEGYRNFDRQQKAFDGGWSQARPGESPHNYHPALAVDLVLNPPRVWGDRENAPPHPGDPRYPYLWDSETPEAKEAWDRLESAAMRHHLVRVDLKSGRDLPHLELPDWRSYVPGLAET